MTRLTTRVLEEREVARIEEAAFRILDEVGIAVEHERATEMLRGLGGRVDRGRVFLAPETVHAALSRLERKARFVSADGSREVVLGERTLRVHNGGGMATIIDSATGRKRPATLRDVEQATRLLDALPQVDAVVPMFGPQDVEPPLMIPASFAALLRHTRKPIMSAAAESAADVRTMVAMAEACCGGRDAFRRRPTLSIMVSPVSPLRLPPKVAEAIMAVAEAGAQFQSLPCPMLGTTSPISIAGAVAQQHAEILASFALAAAVRPDLRVLYSSRISAIDLRTAMSAWGGPEVALSAACVAQVAHRAGFACDTYGLISATPDITPQTTYERFSNALVPALAGVDIISGVGGLDNSAAGSLTLSVIDNEILGYIRHMVGGVSVNEESLAMDLVREVVPEGGTFLDREATLTQIEKGCFWRPGISAAALPGASDDAGGGLIERARDRLDEILRTHQAERLAPAVDEILDTILAEARRELGGA